MNTNKKLTSKKGMAELAREKAIRNANERYKKAARHINKMQQRITDGIKNTVAKYSNEVSHFQINYFDTDYLAGDTTVNIISIQALDEESNINYRIIDVVCSEVTERKLEIIKEIHPTKHQWVYSKKDKVYLDTSRVSVPLLRIKDDEPKLKEVSAGQWLYGIMEILRIDKDIYRVKYRNCYLDLSVTEDEDIESILEYLEKNEIEAQIEDYIELSEGAGEKDAI